MIRVRHLAEDAGRIALGCFYIPSIAILDGLLWLLGERGEGL